MQASLAGASLSWATVSGNAIAYNGMDWKYYEPTTMSKRMLRTSANTEKTSFGSQTGNCGGVIG
jgi:hypothetical protein